MNEHPGYTSYHPRWIRPRMSTYWWLQSWPYLLFILREVSSVFVAWFVVYLLLLVGAVNQGDSSYREFLQWSGTPAVLLLNVVSFFFVVYHAITFFNAAPQAIVMHLGGRRVPGVCVTVSNYGAWALVSALVVWVVLGGR